MSSQHTASSLTGLPVKDRVRRIGLAPQGRAIPGLRAALSSAMCWQRAHSMFKVLGCPIYRVQFYEAAGSGAALTPKFQDFVP